MTIWMTLNSIAIAMLSGMLFLVARQIGFLIQRWGPIGARGTTEGPRIGENIAAHFAPAAEPNSRAKLLVFMSKHCSVCSVVRGGCEALAKAWHSEADIYLLYDCTPDEAPTELERLAVGLFFKRDRQLRHALGVHFVPFAASTDTHGVVAAKGLVNDISNLESLLEFERANRRRASDPLTEISAAVETVRYATAEAPSSTN